MSAPINFSPLIYAPATPSISQPESFSLAQISRHPLPARTNGRTKRVHANATRASRCSYCFLCDLHLHLHLHPHLPSFQPTHSTLSLSLSFYAHATVSTCFYKFSVCGKLLCIWKVPRLTFWMHLAFTLSSYGNNRQDSQVVSPKLFLNCYASPPSPLSRTVSRIFAGSRRRGVSCNNRQLTRGRLTGWS